MFAKNIIAMKQSGEMSIFFRWLLPILSCCVMTTVFIGCAASSIVSGPYFNPLPSTAKKIGIFTPDIIVFDVSSGGIQEYRDDWSKKCDSAIIEPIIKELAKRGFMGIRILDDRNDLTARQIRDNMQFHCEVIQNYLYGKNAFIPEIDHFDYSIGDIKLYCDRYGLDAVLFLYGFDEHFSDGRRKMLKNAANVKTARSIFVNVLLLLFTGSFSVTTYRPPLERTYLCAAVASRDGPILWYNRKLAADNADLSSSSALGSYLEDFLTIRRVK